MNIALSPEEIRVLGCLLEKAVLTPDQYPLTLNALTNACNQKSSRDPVMAMEPGAVGRAARQLEEQRLVVREENFKSRVEKYKHRFCNTPFSEFQFSAAEYALVCLLLLRGPQTPGELRSRSGRLHTFADNEAVRETLEGLMTHDGGALVVRLPRQPGRQDDPYMHCFGDTPPEAAAVSPRPAAASVPAGPGPDRDTADLLRRVEALEQAVADLRERLQARDG